MTRIKLAFWLLLAGLTALWLAADPAFPGTRPFAQLQNSYVNYTGIIAIGVMSVALLLALRSVAIEPHVGGLDKSYRLHKWLGVTALIAVLAHWLVIQSPDWLRAAGLMAPAPRGARRSPAGSGIMHTLQGPARSVGGWMLYFAVALLVLALLRRVPYRWFLKTHRLLAIVFLLLVFHSAVLLKTAYWSSAIAYVVAALMAAGVVAAVLVLFRRIGRTRQAVGEVENVSSHRDGSILGVGVCLKDRWAGHEPGQFAFVNFNDGEGPHPFTITNAWQNDGRLFFLIKGLGDYTRELPGTVTKGSLVTVEGPYGRFTFSGSHERQIWISVGIGVTPFISRMQHLAAHPDGKEITLFHTTGSRDLIEVRQLRALAHSAHVSLHVWVSGERGRLTAERVRETEPRWRDADIWFCGPVEFGNALRDDLVEAGLAPNAFHQELFHLR